MSLLTFCNKYRSKSEKVLRKLTISGFIVSGLLHVAGVMAFVWLNQNNLDNASQPPPNPIEFQVIEPPEPEVAKVEPEPVVEPEPQPEPETPSETVQEARISAKQLLPDPIPESASPQPKAIAPSPSQSTPQTIPLGSLGGQSLEGTLTGTQGSSLGMGDQGSSQGQQAGSPLGTGTGSSQGTGNGNGEGASWISLKCISNCQPQYPSTIAKKVPGKVIVQFRVETDGSVSSPQVLETSGNSELDKAAVSAVGQMKFSPPEDGRSRRAKLPINYTVPN
ncbi:energy transducer TonB [Crocosphaera subtropica]|nr:energy transducer TonB [Crocosphaera subtropica]